MSKRIFRLVTLEARKSAARCIAESPDGFVVEVREPTRNLEQNSLLWVLLTKFSQQLQWPVNGRMVSMDAEDWKHVLSAAFKRERARLAMGLDGGVVMLGLRTSQMGRKEFAEFLEFVQSVAADRGVTLDDAKEEA